MDPLVRKDPLESPAPRARLARLVRLVRLVLLARRG